MSGIKAKAARGRGAKAPGRGGAESPGPRGTKARGHGGTKGKALAAAVAVAAGTLLPAGGSATSSPVFLPYQVAWILDESKVAFWEKSRRVGADWTEAFRVVRERMNGTRVCDYWYSSADESAAVEFIQYVVMWVRDVYGQALELNDETETVDDIKVRVLSVQLPEINGDRGGKRPRITAMASSPKAFRSKGGDVGISEYAHHKFAAELWKAAGPVAMWGGRIRVISTHNGVGSKFNEFIRQARRYTDPATYGAPRKTDVRASVHRTTIHDAVEQGLVERLNAVSGESLTREEFIAQEQATCGSVETWREEYEVEPGENAESYFPYELLRPVARAPISTIWNPRAFIAEVIRLAQGADALYAGSDIGRKSDLFAVWVLAKFGGMRKTIGVFAGRSIRFSEMESVIHLLMGVETAGGVRRLCIDETGLGMQLAERMVERYRSRVEPVTFTGQVKEDLVTTARRDIEEATVELPDDPELLGEFNAFKKIVTTANNVRYAADETAEGHADRATAGMLALHAAKRPPVRMRAVPVRGGAVL